MIDRCVVHGSADDFDDRFDDDSDDRFDDDSDHRFDGSLFHSMTTTGQRVVL